MIIFESEAKIDGLADKIMANLSVSYNSQLQPWTPSERESIQKESLSRSIAAHKQISKAGLNDSDLYFTKSILVSTNWNKNDDVFSTYETWAARHTPSHKPTNLEHDETRMVGHITETWALDNDGLLIPDNTIAEDLPSFYHIANGAVIYTNWQDDNLIERTESLIASIQEGKKFVSMEAIFTNFSYAVVTPEDERHVVARTQDTAFLTKHLRCYGGTGEFEGCKLGRILKNITFSGKGYVDKPANPHSIIFQDDGSVFNYTAASTENPFSKESGVSFSCSSISSKKNLEKSSMSDNTQSVDLLKSQNEDYKQAVASLQVKVEELTKASSEAGIKTLKSEIETLSAKLEATETERDEAVASIETLTSEKDSINTQLTEATEAKEALEKEVTEAKEAQVKANRISHLVDGGVEKDVAEAKVETFASLSDEQFDSIAEDIISAKKMKDDEKDKDKDKKSDASEESSDDDISQDDAEASADESVLEGAEAEEQADLTAEASTDEPSEFETQVSELRKVIASRFGYDEEAESN